MSSTNRSKARDQHISDYYVTPIDKINDFLQVFIRQIDSTPFTGTILDPCAGGDKNHPMSYPEALINIGVPPEKIDTIDIRLDSFAKVKVDYLTYDCKNKYDVIITNPPFTIARQIIEKALDECNHNGWVVMLLRLNFLGGSLRKDLWNKQMPEYIFVHHRRMSFTDDGKTDSIEYAHFCWQKGSYPEFSKIKVI